MFSGGLFQATPGMRDALTMPEPSQEWLEAALDRCERRKHTADTAALRDEIDHLRLHLATLFRLLIARGTFTVEEAQRLAAELETGDEAGRDLVSGAELPPKENPFQELRESDGTRRRGWRAWVRFGVVSGGILALIAFGIGLRWYVNWVQRP